jgi:hypothetical protein
VLSLAINFAAERSDTIVVFIGHSITHLQSPMGRYPLLTDVIL